MKSEDRDTVHAPLSNVPFVPPAGAASACFIRNLPPELLLRIFEAGNEDDIVNEDNTRADFCDNDSDTMGSPDDHLPFPTTVSHVCRHWRNVACSMPTLWTTIYITPKERPPYERVSMLLDRSKDVSIDIYINCAPDEDDCYVDPPSNADLLILFSILIPHVHRWRTIDLTVPEYESMFRFLTTASDCCIPVAPRLTTLELYDLEDEYDSFPYPNMSEHLTLFGGLAPLLTKVVLWGVHVDWSQHWIASTPSLTCLELCYHTENVRPSWTQFSAILRGASSLKRLVLCQSGPAGDPIGWFIQPILETDLNAPITLSNVKDLVLEDLPEECVIGLLRRLHLPVLKRLALAFYDGDYSEFVRELTGPATSPSREQSRSLLSQLENLRITELPCDIGCMQTLFAGLQNVVLFKISAWFLCEFFLDIRWDDWLPRLATLHVFGESSRCGIALRILVRVRRDAGVPLTTLYVEKSCREEMEGEDVTWLKENVGTFRFVQNT